MDFRHIPDFPVAGRPLRKPDGPMKKDAMDAGKHDLSAFALNLGAILKQSTTNGRIVFFHGFAWILMDFSYINALSATGTLRISFWGHKWRRLSVFLSKNTRNL